MSYNKECWKKIKNKIIMGITTVYSKYTIWERDRQKKIIKTIIRHERHAFSLFTYLSVKCYANDITK